MKHKLLKQYLLITLGVACVAVPFYFLFLSQDLVTGGVTGLSVILNHLITAPWFKVSYVIYALNIILLFIGWIFLGKDFFLKTIYGSLLLPTITYIFELFEIKPEALFAYDPNFSLEIKLITATIVGGVIMGFGLGICYKNNGSTGGMDVIQKMMSKYLHAPYSLCVYLTDGAVVLASVFVFGIVKTTFSFVTILIIGIVADYIEMGGRIRRTVFIISKENEVIKAFILDKLERGVTISPVQGGYSNKPYDMLICTLSKRESYVLRDYIAEVDPTAFTFYVSAREVYGDGFE